MDNNMQDLVAALNGHNVTDENGNISEEAATFEEESTTTEPQTTEDEFAGVEKPTEEEAPEPKHDAEAKETELAEDETGRKYVPEDRFKEVYGKMKKYERELGQRLQQQEQTKEPVQRATSKPQKVDKAELLEIEMLYDKFPEFDPYSNKYNVVLDEMGSEIYRTNPGISRLEAARRATSRARQLAEATGAVISEARTLKAQNSDGAIAGRVQTRGSGQPNFDEMTDAQLEAWMKANGQW